jgi:hypothetical protein
MPRGKDTEHRVTAERDATGTVRLHQFIDGDVPNANQLWRAIAVCLYTNRR